MTQIVLIAAAFLLIVVVTEATPVWIVVYLIAGAVGLWWRQRRDRRSGT